MRSIAFIIPYFGKLPEYFSVWLYSCAQNPTIDFYVFTDDSSNYNFPSNVHRISMSFEEIKQRLQSQFTFQISLERPYKLCDFKPVYGGAFEDYLKNYDFWGHCDVDLIWGNIRHFFTDELLDAYDRVLWQGHCSLYRNTENVNNYYCTLPSCGCMDWKQVYTNPDNQSFDEYAEHNGGGLSLIMERNRIPMYKEWIFADLAVGLRRFQCGYTENSFYTTDADSFGSFFVSNQNGLFLHYRKSGEFRSKEFLYCHFQKRKIKNVKAILEMQENRQLLLLPPGTITTCSKLNNTIIRRQFKRNIFRNMIASVADELVIIRLTNRIIRKLKRQVKCF